MRLKTGEMSINGVDISAYGARLLDYSVGATTMTKAQASSSYCVVPAVFKTNLGTRPLSITLSFAPTDNTGWHSIWLNKSNFDTLLANNTPVEITLPDGFIYSAIIDTASNITPDKTDCFDVTYTLRAIMHLPEKIISPVTASNNFWLDPKGTATVNCKIKMVPEQACSTITVKITNQSATKVIVPTITFTDVPAGGELVVDGFNKTVTLNGKNYMGNCDLVTFPLLEPIYSAVYITPASTIAKIATTISYYPTYV